MINNKLKKLCMIALSINIAFAATSCAMQTNDFESQSDNQSDNQVDTKVDNQSDNQVDTKVDNQSDNQVDTKVDNHANEAISEYETKDIYGNTVTSNIFSEKDITVINIWGTFCSPCIGEMPELGNLAKELPDNAQIIGLVQDIANFNDTNHIQLAKNITSRAGADFPQLIVNGTGFAKYTQGLVGVPTTIFVDKYGNVIGEPIVGADVPRYKAFVREYLNGR